MGGEVGGEVGGMRVGTVELVGPVGEGVGDCGEGEDESGGLVVAGSGGTDVMVGGGAAAEPLELAAAGELVVEELAHLPRF